jgi:hypothetical protein
MHDELHNLQVAEVKHDEMGRECSMHKEIRNTYGTAVGNSRGRDYFTDLGVDGRIILKRS